MIKCPYCGSIPKQLKTELTNSKHTAIVHTLCECECGKTFWHYISFNEFLHTTKEGYLEAKI